MKQVWRQLLGVHHASLLFSKTNGICSRAVIILNPKPNVVFNRNFSTKQERDVIKEPAESALARREESLPGEVKEEGKLRHSPEVEARMEYFKEKRRLRKEILSMDEEELKPYLVGVQKKQLLEMQEGSHAQAGISKVLERDRDGEKHNLTDQLAFFQADLDFRLPAIKRFIAKMKEEHQIKLQSYNPQRNSILGDDLAAAHFVLFRKGRVKFLGQDEWMDEYRIDQKTEEDERDLPDMQFNLCTLPTAYDPNYLVEALDASNIPLRYEGLDNLANLSYCKYLKFENCTHLEAWCMDKLAYLFADRLEYLDISGCTGLTEGALCSIVRFRKLKTLVVRNLPQVKNMAVICAILEDSNPDLKIFGVDYEKRLEELKAENELLFKKAKEIEDNTITVETVHGPEHVLDSK